MKRGGEHGAPMTHRNVDAAIIGGGVAGLFTAYELRPRNHDVVVIDPGNAQGAASWAGGGILSSLTPWDVPGVLQPLIAEAQTAYPALAQELRAATGIDPEWQRSGALFVDPPPEDKVGVSAADGVWIDEAQLRALSRACWRPAARCICRQ